MHSNTHRESVVENKVLADNGEEKTWDKVISHHVSY